MTFGAAGSPTAAEPRACGPRPRRPRDGTAQVESGTWRSYATRRRPRARRSLACQRGTPLRLGSSKDGWYPIKYGDGFASDGWVYRGAIGR